MCTFISELPDKDGRNFLRISNFEKERHESEFKQDDSTYWVLKKVNSKGIYERYKCENDVEMRRHEWFSIR